VNRSVGDVGGVVHDDGGIREVEVDVTDGHPLYGAIEVRGAREDDLDVIAGANWVIDLVRAPATTVGGSASKGRRGTCSALGR
jgi:hypothetical protein